MRAELGVGGMGQKEPPCSSKAIAALSLHRGFSAPLVGFGAGVPFTATTLAVTVGVLPTPRRPEGDAREIWARHGRASFAPLAPPLWTLSRPPWPSSPRAGASPTAMGDTTRPGRRRCCRLLDRRRGRAAGSSRSTLRRVVLRSGLPRWQRPRRTRHGRRTMRWRRRHRRYHPGLRGT